MQPVACTGSPEGPWGQLFLVGIMPGLLFLNLDSRQVCVVPLESPRAQWPGSTLPGHNVHPHQAAEQGACDWSPPQGQVQVPWPSEDPQLQEVGIYQVQWGWIWEHGGRKATHGPDGCGVKYIPNRGPLDKWRALHSWALFPP